MMNNYSDANQDLFAYTINKILYKNQPEKNKKFWVDIGSRNFGSGFGQNNTVFLYENGWRGISVDIGNYKSTYPENLSFYQLDFTNYDSVIEMLNVNSNIDKQINYLSFDIDESTQEGIKVLERIINEKNYIFESITIEHDSYRFGTSTRDRQREMFFKLNYILVTEVDLYEDWWVHESVYSPCFSKLNEIKNIKHNQGFSKEQITTIKNIILSIED